MSLTIKRREGLDTMLQRPKADEMEMRLLTNKCTDLNTTEHLNAFDMNSSSNNVNFCNEDSCNVSHTHNLVSTNSFELNTATSLSDDSGVPLTNSSISSGDSYRIGLCKFELELVESDGEVSQFDSLDNSSDGGMSAENFNTLKKGPLAPIDPPPEFQDSPNATLIRQQVLPDYDLNAAENVSTGITHWFSQNSVVKKERNFDFLSSTVTEEKILNKKNYSMEDIYGKRIYSSDSSFSINMYKEPNKCVLDHKEYILESNTTTHNEIHCKHFKAGKRGLASPKELHLDKLSEIHDYDQYYELKNNYPTDIHQKGKSSYIFSPLHHNNVANRPNSRNSLNSRLSSSHNSLSLPNANKADDSIFITQAMSHDTLLSREISDFYNVPIDSDIYAFPVDMIKADLNIYHGNNEKVRSRLKHSRNIKKRRRVDTTEATGIEKYGSKLKMSNNQRHSALENTIEPLHMTLVEVKRFYHNLYSGSNNSSTFNRSNFSIKIHVNNSSNERNVDVIEKSTTANHKIFSTGKSNAHDSTTPINKKISEKNYIQNTSNSSKFINQNEKKPPFSMNLNLKQKFCRIFRFRKNHDNSRSSIEDCTDYISSRTSNVNETGEKIDKKQKFSTRALPPLPNKSQKIHNVTVTPPKEPEFNSVHLASSIEKVKECGWYWGPISSEAAEKVLSNEPDGSFIVRDSSDDHYIFSLSFKLNFCVRHVRIEQDQGTFSFGPYAKFKSRTITEFIEKAVEHSRSGRYLFFLHRRPEHGPMRVQLTNPVSRFKHIQSLQHMCRFVILKAVIRKDLIRSLPLPRRLLDYLSYKHCYSEQVESDSSQSQVSEDRA